MRKNRENKATKEKNCNRVGKRKREKKKNKRMVVNTNGKVSIDWAMTRPGALAALSKALESEEFCLSFEDEEETESDSDSDSGSESESESECDTLDSSTCELDDDDSLIEIEERIKEFSIVGSSPALAAMVFNTADFKLPKTTHREPLDSSSFHGRSTQAESKAFKMRRSTSEECIQSAAYQSAATESSAKGAESDADAVKPHDYLTDLLAKWDITAPKYRSGQIGQFFPQMKEENFESFSNDIATAARTGDLDTFKLHVEQGKSIICCNRFKESTVHTVCRRGHVELLSYIISQESKALRVCDDQGRTPLHDAAWAHEPNFDMVKLILLNCPELLYIQDKRGYTPLAYVGKKQWGPWCKFLEENKGSVMPEVWP